MTDVDGAFEDARLLINGGREHIASFEAMFAELRNSKWLDITAAADCSEMTIKASVTIPPVMKRIAFDITNNLRSALDHAVYASTNVLTGNEGGGTKFPFGDTEAEARADAKRRCKKSAGRNRRLRTSI